MRPPENLETIRLELEGDGVLSVTIDRPEVLNAFNEAMKGEFARLWSYVRAEPDVRAVVLRSEGSRAFSSGLDVTEHSEDGGPRWLDPERPFNDGEDPGSELSPRRNEVWKPVIAAVAGMCAGGAFYWVADCDIVICEPDATFFDPHVTYGMVAALEPIALRFRMHTSDVLRMALLGAHERMGAERALACGLVTEVVPADDLDRRAHELAAIIASQPTAAVQGTVKAIWQSLDVGRAQALATGLMYTQVGNPIGADSLDRAAAKPKRWWKR